VDVVGADISLHHHTCPTLPLMSGDVGQTARAYITLLVGLCAHMCGLRLPFGTKPYHYTHVGMCRVLDYTVRAAPT